MNYEEFVESRRKYLGASDAPIIMGVSPWRTPYDLWLDKLNLAEDRADTFSMKRGRDLEPEARAAYTIHTGTYVEPKMVIHKKIPYMMANFDGVSEDETITVEIKCPGKDDHDLAKSGVIPEKYYPQLQHQLEVIGHNRLHYFSYRDGDVALIEVERDNHYITDLLQKEKEFWDYVKTTTAPPLDDRDYVEHLEDEWVTLSSEWSQIYEDMTKLKEKEKVLREELIRLAANKNSRGGGIRLQKVMRKGAYDMKAIQLVVDVDIENFRKESSESWRISTC